MLLMSDQEIPDVCCLALLTIPLGAKLNSRTRASGAERIQCCLQNAWMQARSDLRSLERQPYSISACR